MGAEKVLIVEDEENERTGLAEVVSDWGYSADTARDGVEGLEKVTRWSPAIVVTDLKMPRMGGLELVERITELAQNIAVVALGVEPGLLRLSVGLENHQDITDDLTHALSSAGD